MQAYKWKTGARLNVDANIAGRMCEELANGKGLTAENLLDANRPLNAPLHDAFEWDDGIAAEGYRLMQARHIINCLVLVQEDDDAPQVRAFFKVASPCYEQTTTLLSIPERKDALLEQAERELQIVKRKYAGLIQLANVIEAINAYFERKAV